MLKLRDIMTRDVITVSPELSIRDAMALLASKRVSGAPVVSGPTVIGVISATDLIDFASALPGIPTNGGGEPGWEEAWDRAPDELAADLPSATYFTELWSDDSADVEERFSETNTPEWDMLAEHTVSEAMSRNVCSLPSSADVRSAADYMRRTGVHRVLVMDDGRLSGIVSTMDVAAAVADDKLVRRTYVFNHDSTFDARR